MPFWLIFATLVNYWQVHTLFMFLYPIFERHSRLSKIIPIKCIDKMHQQNAPTKCSNFIYAPSKCINAFESEHDAFMKIRSKSENRIFHIWPKFEIFNILDYYENKILTHLRKSVFFSQLWKWSDMNVLSARVYQSPNKRLYELFDRIVNFWKFYCSLWVHPT